MQTGEHVTSGRRPNITQPLHLKPEVWITWCLSSSSPLVFLFVCLFVFGHATAARGILISQLGFKPTPAAGSSNHWIAWEFPWCYQVIEKFLNADQSTHHTFVILKWQGDLLVIEWTFSLHSRLVVLSIWLEKFTHSGKLIVNFSVYKGTHLGEKINKQSFLAG